MTIPQPTVPAAGWYTDPSGQPGQRWWDGESWTQQTQPVPQPAQQAPVASGAFAAAMESHASYVPSSAIARPAGWYPDAANYGQQRWWDGNQWTAQVTSPYQGGQGYDVRAPEGTSPYNTQIWAIVGIYAFLGFGQFVYVYSIIVNPPTSTGTGLIVPLSFLAAGLIGWIVSVRLAAADGRELESRGVQRPFHWAFTCIPSYGPTIYIIGRSVVARRRTGSGLAPIWWHFGLAAAGYVIGFIGLSAVLSTMSPYGGYGYGY